MLFTFNPSLIYWRIDYQIVNSQSISGLASLILIKNQLPQSGTCSVQPSNGTSLQTMFQIACSNWQDLDGSIVKYEFFGKNLSV